MVPGATARRRSRRSRTDDAVLPTAPRTAGSWALGTQTPTRFSVSWRPHAQVFRAVAATRTKALSSAAAGSAVATPRRLELRARRPRMQRCATPSLGHRFLGTHPLTGITTVSAFRFGAPESRLPGAHARCAKRSPHPSGGGQPVRANCSSAAVGADCMCAPASCKAGSTGRAPLPQQQAA